MPTLLNSPPLHRHTQQPFPLLLLLLLLLLLCMPKPCFSGVPVVASDTFSFSLPTHILLAASATTTSSKSSADTSTATHSPTVPPIAFAVVKNISPMVPASPQSVSKISTFSSSLTAPVASSTDRPCLPSNPDKSIKHSSKEEENLTEKEPKGPYYYENYRVNNRGHTVIRSANESVAGSDDTFPSIYLDTGEGFGNNDTYLGELELRNWTGTDIGLTIIKALVMAAIIIVSVLGNILVIVSVALHRRLHSTANYLLVSLATADMLVALCAMTFNASVELTGGRWMFGRIMCDLWNSFDVYFSTVSILHLCCISVDRYYAIVRPLEYPLTITRRILAVMLAHCWLAPTLISFLPIFLGWYTTAEHMRSRDFQPHVCSFVVNAVFALVSSAVSFWVPCTVMVVMYFRIFQEARKQERALLNRASSASSNAYSSSIRLGSSASQQQQDPAAAAMARQQLLVALQQTPFTPVTRHQEFLMKTLSDTSSTVSVATTSSGIPSLGPSGSSSSRSSSGAGMVNNLMTGNGSNAGSSTKPNSNNGNSSGSNWRHNRHGSTASWHGPTRHSSLVPCNRRLHSTPIVTSKAGPPQVGRREHKAARTLGLIMGAFVLCWLPFFIWYVSINICGPSCHCPPAVVTALFWIGYFNSTLNPFIYAYFRTDFREAFHRTLKRLSCCKPRQPAGVFV
ncbi:5-hydroxytryptamine receptor 1A-like [Palaemon carinicauda]|uniref:5-hydroxytryptamine receptor 1A-like n=1 Tax=Palaemon carinicauda TaxID=392227 RepID=UPI0035B659C8